MSTTSMAIFSNPLFATYSVYARNASIHTCHSRNCCAVSGINDTVIRCQNMLYSHEKPLHSSSTEVDIFFSLILSYFCFFVAARRPCHGRLPRRKYIMMYAIDSTSSRRLCSMNHKYSSPTTQLQQLHTLVLKQQCH